MSSRVLGHVRARFVTGILLLLPLLITVWLIRILFGLVNGNVTPWVMMVIRAQGLEDPAWPVTRFIAPLVGLGMTVGFVYLFGLLVGNLAGRRLWELIERAILRIPLVKGVYGSARQLLDAFSVGSKGGFSRVVLVEYPRVGIFTVGFVTNDSGSVIPASGGPIPVVAVFLPTTPNPTSGWVAFIPRNEVLDLDVSIEDGIKLVVSGAIVTPRDLASRIRPLGAPAPPSR